MKHKGFSLFEVLISLVIVGVMLLSLSGIFADDQNLEIYYELQEIENHYVQTQTILPSENIKLKQR